MLYVLDFYSCLNDDMCVGMYMFYQGSLLSKKYYVGHLHVVMSIVLTHRPGYNKCQIALSHNEAFDTYQKK